MSQRRLLRLVAVLRVGVAYSQAQNGARIEKLLVVVSNPPPVQMLVPGFSVRELPLELNNINNLVYRDYASVLRDIVEPSAAINPDHIAYNVELMDGSVETGVLVGDSPQEVVLGLTTGQNLRISRTRIVSMKASATSVMPEGLWLGLDRQRQKDLMTFLLTPQLQGAPR